jgi:hypothetical protein
MLTVTETARYMVGRYADKRAGMCFPGRTSAGNRRE